MKVLLIGNGCSTIEYKFGKVIDSEFDLVLRMNRFKTKGYEEHVGSKTDIWVVTDNAFNWVLEKKDGIEGSENWKNYNGIYIGVPSFKYQELTTDWSRELGIEVNQFPKEVGDFVQDKLDLLSNQWPTLGIQCLYFLILSKADVFIYGFDGKNKKYKYLHYYDDETTPEWETKKYYDKKLNHDDEKEFEHIKGLIRDKEIKRLQDYYTSEE